MEDETAGGEGTRGRERQGRKRALRGGEGKRRERTRGAPCAF